MPNEKDIKSFQNASKASDAKRSAEAKRAIDAKQIEDGKKAYAALLADMKEAGYPEKEAINFASLLVRVACGADLYGAEKEEYDVFTGVTGVELTFDEFAAMTKNAANKGFVDAIDEIVDGLNAKAKKSALDFVEVFLNADEVLSANEEALLKKLKA